CAVPKALRMVAVNCSVFIFLFLTSGSPCLAYEAHVLATFDNEVLLFSITGAKDKTRQKQHFTFPFCRHPGL
ncbi:MAG: hypothetical protein VXV93_06090, partial [Pseudomonadota bacterium]|nr:hypothetical protein [Pseudomonadota bacterium]